MKNLDFIGLNATDAAKTEKELQQLLADLQVFHGNLHNFHWNVKGEQFFTLHEKFEELYAGVASKIDEVAERILILDGVPQHKFSEYLKVAKVKESDVTMCPSETVQLTLDALKIIIADLRAVQDVAGKSGDDVTADIATDYLSGYEKDVWMLVAYLTRK